MSLHISVDCFGISIDCFGQCHIKKWMIFIITVNLSTGIISVNSVRISLSAYPVSESEKTVSSDQPAQKKFNTNSGSGSASNSRVKYDAETNAVFGPRTKYFLMSRKYSGNAELKRNDIGYICFSECTPKKYQAPFFKIISPKETLFQENLPLALHL